MNWTGEQKDVFEGFAGRRNLAVEACAGSGKTTTMIEGVKRAPFRGSALVCAFNARIAADIKEKVSYPIVGKTLHALGYGYLRKKDSNISVDPRRGMKIARRAQEALIDEHRKRAKAGVALSDNPYSYRDWPVTKLVKDLAGAAKNVAPFAESVEDLVSVADSFDLLPDQQMVKRGLTREVICRIALKCLELARFKDGTCDFDDQLWLPLVWNWTHPVFDLVVVDEAQDLNPVQVHLVRRLGKGRYVFCGDPNQTLYQFRGARDTLIHELADEYDCDRFPLTTTFRCAEAVAREAREIVPDFWPREGAPEGGVHKIWDDDLDDEVRPGDFILSRRNADLMDTWRRLVAAGVPAYVLGKGEASTLASLVTRVSKEQGTNDVRRLEKALKKWSEEEKKAAEEDPDRGSYAESVRSQVHLICQMIPGTGTVKELKTKLLEAFADPGEVDDTKVILSTVHKVKGLEADRVFCLSWNLQAKDNVRYVAVTRARDELHWVSKVRG